VKPVDPDRLAALLDEYAPAPATSASAEVPRVPANARR